MVNSAQYHATLGEEFKPAICCKCKGMLLTNGLVLHHDNTQPRTAAMTAETI
jgi:hypothetical protein